MGLNTGDESATLIVRPTPRSGGNPGGMSANTSLNSSENKCYRVTLIQVIGLVLLGTHQSSHMERCTMSSVIALYPDKTHVLCTDASRLIHCNTLPHCYMHALLCHEGQTQVSPYMFRARMRRQPRRNPRQAPFPMRGSFAPPGPPGIITGGDYDRLPQPFLGGTPGMFGGGGSGFGGQGPPASLFLGGNRGTSRAARAASSFRLS
ncbi:TPA: hypothetical protein ACH3X1_008670 [Trebouxia sp. C0004]